MGELKRGARKLIHSPGRWFKDQFNSMKEGSRQIAEQLGYEKAGVTPKSERTKQMLADAVPPVMPEADEEELRRAKRRRVASASRGGRAATILTNDDDTLG